MFCIGIDPGFRSGALAIFDGRTVVHVDWLPFVQDGSSTYLNISHIDQILRTHVDAEPRDVIAIIERQQSMPKQGVSSTFKTGFAFGAICTYLQARGFSTSVINAVDWKREMGLIGKDKDASRAKVAMMHPEVHLPLKKDHNKADAILIGHFGLLKTERHSSEKANL